MTNSKRCNSERRGLGSYYCNYGTRFRIMSWLQWETCKYSMLYFVPKISYRNTKEMKLVIIHKSPIRATLRKTVDCILWDFSVKKLGISRIFRKKTFNWKIGSNRFLYYAKCIRIKLYKVAEPHFTESCDRVGSTGITWYNSKCSGTDGK